MIPEWVLFTLDTSKSLDKILKSYARIEPRNSNKIRQFQYEWEVVSDRGRLRFFYDRMYLPYIVSRFGKSALLVSFAFLETLLPKAKLLLVKRQDEYVSGCFISTAGSRPQVYFQGIMDGRKEYLKDGAVTALYYYTIVWAKENHYTEVDFGHCRPFLNDGVFLYKKRWGMKVQISPKKHRVLYLSIRNLTPQVKEFLLNNPFLYEDRKQLKGLVFVQRNGLISKSEREAIERKYSIPGLNRISVVLADDPDGKTINPKELSQNDADNSQTP